MTPEEFERLRAGLPNYSGTRAVNTGTSSAFDWTTAFIRSGFESMGELVGIRPSSDTIEWRSENPGAALLSEFGGMAVPYMGWFGITKRIKRLDDAIDSIGDIDKAPFALGAAREAVRFAPFEAGRVLASQVVGEEDIGTMAGEAAINLALGAGVGGIISSIASAGTRTPSIMKLAPGVDIAAPNQIQQRYLQQLLNTGKVAEPNVGPVRQYLQQLRDRTRAERLPVDQQYVNLPGPKPFVDTINRLFDPERQAKSVNRRLLVQAAGNFDEATPWQTFASRVGLPENFEDYGQYFRAINFKGQNAGRAAAIYENPMLRNMENIGDGWLLKRENNDGLFVMARKVDGAIGKPDANDSWLIFKTDSPGQFVPDQQRWANTVIGKNAWVPEAKIAADGGNIYNTATGLMKQIPFTNYLAFENSTGGIVGAAAKLLPKQVTKGGNEAVARAGEFIKEFLAPARKQFGSNPLANWIHTIARGLYEAAETEAQRLVDGLVSIDPGKNLFISSLRGQQNELNSDAVRTLINGLSDEELEQFWRHVWRPGKTADQTVVLEREGLISRNVVDFARKMEDIDKQVWESLNKAQKATGHALTRRRPGHYGLSHMWEGDSRIVLRDAAGRPQAIAAGFNRKGAQANAVKIQEKLELEGIRVTPAEEFQLSRVTDIPVDVKPIISTPSFTMERQGLRGFRWDMEAFNRKDLLDTLSTNIRSRLRYEASISMDDLLAQHLDKLAKDDPFMFRILTARLNDLKGAQGPLGMIQNQLVDRVLAPILGQNSATQIARITNSTMWHLNLGAGKLAYPVINAMTFIQTVIPEVAFVMGAAPAKLATDYTHFAIGGTRGPSGVMAALDPIKFMARSVREMRKPSKELLELFGWATNDRVIDPRLVEEYIGESATKLTDLRAAISSPGGFGSWLKAASEFLPAQSERLGRAHAFTVGYIVARDFLKIADPRMRYNFARQFTEKTMYLYSTADRPRIFTTPAGSMFGLFKNWMVNYTATMLDYTGEGLTRNNWAPLLWQTAGTAAIGGVAATPLYLAADGFSRAFTGEPMLKTAYEAFGEQGGNGFMYGLPAVLANVSMSSQTATPLANPIRDGSMLFSTAHLDRLQYFMKAMGSGFDHWQATGEHPGRNGKFLQQLTRAVAPTSLYRVIGAAQEGAITSLSTGYPITQDASLYDKIWYMAGFNPVEIDRAYAVAEELYGRRAARAAAVARYGQAFAEAQMEGDSAMMSRLLREVYVAGIDPDSVLRSASQRMKNMTTPMLERTFGAEDLQEFDSVLTPGG